MGIRHVTTKAVFLDRDGVINESVVGPDGIPRPPPSLDEFRVVTGTLEACRVLRQLGFLLIVVTNQPDVARRTQTRDAVEAINRRLARALPIDDIRVCYHDDVDECDCRKPRPGLLLSAARDWGIDLSSSYMIGDRWKDIEAGRRAGCTTVLIGSGDGQPRKPEPTATLESLASAARWIRDRLSRTGEEETMTELSRLRVKLFADGADLPGILGLAQNPLIQGFTTNPTLMRKAGIDDYETFAHAVLAEIRDRPVSFEVLSDEFDEMAAQARLLASWGDNVVVKIPITNTRHEPSFQLLSDLAADGVRLNVTAIMTLDQVRRATEAVADASLAYVSVFAGRIADTGRDPVSIMAEAVDILRPHPKLELLWASPRELLNIFQADAVGCHIITATNDILSKLTTVGKDLDEFSLDTVRMFYDDAQRAGFHLPIAASIGKPFGQ
jgi:transaldolase